MKKELLEIIEGHHSLRLHSLNLLPSENVLSPLARKFLASDMSQRYFFKDPFKGENGISYSYSGSKYIERIVDIGEQIAKDLFAAKYVSLYPVSGHQANLAVLLAFTKPGDTIMVFDSKHGGYPGLDKDKLPKYLGLKVIYIQTVEENPELIDYPTTYSLIQKFKPKLVIYSSAHTLFPINIEELTNKSQEVGAKFIYDGSHPLGLIAGGQFQKPLQEGADVLIAGTQKSFPGPQGGIISTNKYGDELEQVNHFVIIDNPHFHRIAALTTSLLEMKANGQQYAIQVVKNTKALAKALFDKGFDIKYSEYNYTESHMFKIRLSNSFSILVKKLEKANIMIDTAGRIGTAEMTRMGMKEAEMKIIADFIFQVSIENDFDNIKQRVINFRDQFQTVCYTDI
jgi:glycine hydroxymethyltransferase